MGKFAKIIELPNDEQIVVIRVWDEENGYCLELQTEIEGMSVTTTAGFDQNEDARDDAWYTYDVERGERFYDEMRKLLLDGEEQ
jgi:hypothetical protein